MILFSLKKASILNDGVKCRIVFGAVVFYCCAFIKADILQLNVQEQDRTTKQTQKKKKKKKVDNECTHKTLEKFDKVLCMGEGSCAHSIIKIEENMEEEQEYEIDCWGSKACENATIVLQHDNTTVYKDAKSHALSIKCRGAFSCPLLSVVVAQPF
ncbi:hypothetical protein RFI_26537 [Reticulomyxa filosa]|uniref:Uncharacterized protein n=1 Tax=Reticulomyxa filosa TaxID=46433 RepID=X6MB23_RETFI|nr:hypothetical protein RFI_26537 [Reticulomyxa filosa]|eukprot:ETO10841.1 hypothetical protein RFI_26537 [Reticulomyxa filosa]